MTLLASAATGKIAMMSRRRRLAWCAMAILSVVIAIVSFRYLFGKGPVPDNIKLNSHFNPWIAVHAASAATALLLGSAQFLSTLRQRRPAVHRISGRLYVAGCLIGGVSALILAPGVSAGPISSAGFGMLGVAWLVTTITAVHQILKRNVNSHERWMIRSFALTFSAITLRLYLPLSSILGIDFLLAYRVVSWMCWIPNMLFAEWYIDRRQIIKK